MNKKMTHKSRFGWLKKLFTGVAFAFSLFCFSSCATIEKQSTSYNYQTISCTYNGTNDSTTIVWTSYIENESIYSIKNFSFCFDLYKDGSRVMTSDYYIWNIEIVHGGSNSGNRSFIVKGNFDDATINSWKAEYANLWESYLGWFIGTIVVGSLVVIIFTISLIRNDGDIGEALESGSWIFYFLIPIGVSVVSSGITSWVSLNWVPLCIVAIGAVSVAILIGIISFLGYLFGNASFGTYVPTSYASYETPQIEEKKSKKTSKDEEDMPTSTPKTKKKTTAKSKISFKDIAGLDDVKEIFKEKVILPFEHPDIYKKFGKKAGGGILLYGLPGTGKTMFAEAASKELDATFIPVKCSDIKSKWYGESEQNVKAIFNKAKRSEKAIIFFDEFEAIGSKRNDDSNNGNNDLVPEILAEMQGIGSNKSDSTILIIAATNKPWAIDSAFMRPGRFDEKIYIPLPDFSARKKLFEIQLAKLPVAKDLDYSYLAKITEGFNGADIKEVCEKLKMSAIKDSLEKGTEQTIGMDDVRKIEKSIKSSVSQEDIEQLKAFEKGLY